MFLFLDKVTDFHSQFMELSKNNPVVAGAVSLWGLGVLTYLVRDIPNRIKNFIFKQLTTSLTVNNCDYIYYDLLAWISQNKMHSFVRSLSFSRKDKGNSWSRTDEMLAMGYGRQWFIHAGKLMCMDRSLREANNTVETKEEIVLTVFSRKHTVFKTLFDVILCDKKADPSLKVYSWKGDTGWVLLSKQFPRVLDTVALPKKQMKAICNHIDAFLTDKEWYKTAGIPWRTGLLLSGPPGTGKTSLIKALCSHYKKSLYLIDMINMNDMSLRSAMASVPEGEIVAIEDIDAAGITTRPSEGDVKTKGLIAFSGGPKAEKVEDLLCGVTLSGALNAIDGPASGEGRILIATSNFPDRLDVALVRPGRFDFKTELGFMTTESLCNYISRLYPEYKDLDGWEIRENIPACNVQSLVFQHRQNPEAILEQIAFRKSQSSFDVMNEVKQKYG